ncbi:S41 family peptidase [Uniformispora flossi]|uniref:S41 family peptidase n=1 Tax=Uniformispora flossi TaxID=3390723 RepID=UPI003C302807
MTSGRVRRRAVLALAFGAALTTGAATGAWYDTAVDAAVPGQRGAETRVRTPLPPGGVPLDGVPLGPDEARELLSVLDDPWAAYYPADAVSGYRRQVDGTYPGVGLTLRQAAGWVTVAYVQPAGPAARAGIVEGDEITAVDGTPAGDLGLAGVVAALRGPVGTPVTLTVGARPVDLVREILTGTDVTAQPVPDTGLLWLRVAGFGRGTAERVRAALARAPEGVLLDLRGNPGGLVDEAAAVASAFLPPGPVVSYDDGTGGRRELDVAGPPGDTDTPVVVLADGGTASAAEVLLAALRDRGRAVVVGSTTYGKGSVQAPTTLGDGGVLNLTIGHWYPPGGHAVDGRGIDPDIAVPAGEAEARGVEVLEGLADE